MIRWQADASAASWIGAAVLAVAAARRPALDCHHALPGVPADEYRLINVQCEHDHPVGWPARPPRFCCCEAKLLCCLGSHPVKLELSLPVVGAGDRAVP